MICVVVVPFLLSKDCQYYIIFRVVGNQRKHKLSENKRKEKDNITDNCDLTSSLTSHHDHNTME